MRTSFVRLGLVSLAVVVVGLAVSALGGAEAKKTRLMLFVGSASKPPMVECQKVYEKLHPDVTLDILFGGSGTLLNQMRLEQIGDIYLPGSDDYMDKAEAQKAVLPATRKIVCYLVPAICVQKGNPKKIRGLEDLARPGLTLGLAKAGAVCLGDVSEEILTSAGLLDAVRKNVLIYAASCELTQQLVQLGEVDAVIGWDSFAAWTPDKIETVPIAAKYMRVRNVPAALTVYSTQQKAAREFIAFLTSKQGQAIFAKHGYPVKPPKLAPSGKAK
jgi:molybdate transport system substrate-binding protein